jgi:hypothetical protein
MGMSPVCEGSRQTGSRLSVQHEICTFSQSCKKLWSAAQAWSYEGGHGSVQLDSRVVLLSSIVFRARCESVSCVWV